MEGGHGTMCFQPKEHQDCQQQQKLGRREEGSYATSFGGNMALLMPQHQAWPPELWDFLLL